MTGKIFVASSDLTVGFSDGLSFDTPFRHLILIHDGDGNPMTTGDQQYIEAIPNGSALFGNLATLEGVTG